MIEIRNILRSLSKPLDAMSVDKVMIQQRDKSVPESLDSFIVVSLPVTIYNKTYGEGYGLSTTFCRFEIYVRKKGGKINLNLIDKLSSQLQSLFPISDEYLIASKPRVLLDGDDDEGFSVVTIQATLNIIGNL